MWSENKVILNIAPISFSQETIEIGHIPYAEQAGYNALREDHRNTHAFRYDNRTKEILNVSVQPGVPPIGRVEEQLISKHLLLMAKAVQTSILLWVQQLPILNSNKKLTFLGKTKKSLLLTQAVEQLNLPTIPGLEVALRYEVDCRMFRNADIPYLGLVVDVSTSNLIEIPVARLHADGLPLQGRYVCQRVSWHGNEKLDLLGRVKEVQGSRIILADTRGLESVELDHALLEPRLENFSDVVKLYYGQHYLRVLSTLADVRSSINTVAGKFASVDDTLYNFRSRSFVIGNSVEILIGDLLENSAVGFPEVVTTERPTLLFGPQGRRKETSPDLGVSRHGPYMYMQHERNTPLIAIVCESQYRGRVEQFVQALIEGFPSELWNDRNRLNPFAEGLIGKFRLSRVRLEIEECTASSADAYDKASNRLLERLSQVPDLAIIQTRKRYEQLSGSANPYFVSKAAFLMAGVPTQAIHVENMENYNGSLAYTLNNVALAIYAKLDGVPWVISTFRPTTHELVIGLGAADVMSGRLGERKRYVGLTTLFQGDGRYLVWGLTREVEFEHYAQALLENLRTTVNYVRNTNAWQEGDKVRLVCHVYKRLRDKEVSAIKSLVQELVSNYFEVEFAFLDISWQHPYYMFAPDQQGIRYFDRVAKEWRYKGEGIADRGLCLLLDNTRGLLQLTGPRDVKTDLQGTPNPLLVELHPDSDFRDMHYLLRQIYHFSYMSWRSFFPGSSPVTITYSHLIARFLGNLNTLRNWDSRVITVGSLRDRKWFL